MIKYIMLRHLGVTKKRQKHCKNIASAILLSKFKEFYVNLKKLRLRSFLLRTKRKIRNTKIVIPYLSVRAIKKIFSPLFVWD